MNEALQSALEPIFKENFASRGELGASVSVWREGREIASLAGGLRERQRKQPWDAGTLALIYSGTKAPAAACVLKCLWDAGISLDAPVAGVWPQFTSAGKEAVTFAHVLSHRAGLAAVDDPPDVFDYPGVIRRLEKQAPLWHLDQGHGYHPRTSGYLWDEIVRRVAGLPLGRYWRQSFADPLGLDFWIGLPSDRLPDVSPMHAARTPPVQDPFLEAYANSGSLTHRAFNCPIGLFSVSSMNTAAARITSFPAFGGIGSATALAKFYCMLASGGQWDGLQILPSEAAAALSSRLANGFDLVLRIETAFSAGVMQDPLGADGKKLRSSFGPSLRAFGQPGAGGSLGFADPDLGLGFAYVMNQMEPGVLPNPKSVLLIERMYEILGKAEAGRL
jgi:CubicO group peptidase (beta-lactamase class C family)